VGLDLSLAYGGTRSAWYRQPPTQISDHAHLPLPLPHPIWQEAVGHVELLCATESMELQLLAFVRVGKEI
jgi:hypothetical protein